MTEAGVMTIDAIKGENGIAAGSYATTVQADWLDRDGALQSKQASFNTSISGDAEELVTAKDLNAGTATLANATTGTLNSSGTAGGRQSPS